MPDPPSEPLDHLKRIEHSRVGGQRTPRSKTSTSAHAIPTARRKYWGSCATADIGWVVTAWPGSWSNTVWWACTDARSVELRVHWRRLRQCCDGELLANRQARDRIPARLDSPDDAPTVTHDHLRIRRGLLQPRAAPGRPRPPDARGVRRLRSNGMMTNQCVSIKPWQLPNNRGLQATAVTELAIA